MSLLDEISAKVQTGRLSDVKTLVKNAIDEGIPAKQVLEGGLIAGMAVIGEKFKSNEIFVPEVLIAARAMKAGTDLLKPYLVSANVKPIGRACIGTVEGDLHDIGKNLVKMMLEGKSIEVIDLGVNVKPEQFIAAVREYNCTLVCCSALLTTTMGKMKDVVDMLVREGLRDRVKVMVGGAPVTEAFCESIGADGYTVDAASAADMAVRFLSL